MKIEINDEWLARLLVLKPDTSAKDSIAFYHRFMKGRVDTRAFIYMLGDYTIHQMSISDEKP